MDDQQAAEALAGAVQEDTGREGSLDAGIGAAPAQTEPTPVEQAVAPVVTPQEEEATTESAAPTEPETAATEPEELDSFTTLDPTTIPDHLQPWYKQMQADYTRKTQAVAEQRKVLEQVGAADPQQAQAALALFNNLQDPQFAMRFYETLGGTLQQAGLTPAQQQAVVAAQESNPVMHQAAIEAVAPNAADDPEAYFHSKINELETRYAEMTNSLAAEREQAQREQFQLALSGEVARQEEYLKETNTHWKDKDWDAVYKMADAFGGNLIEAANLYEDAVGNRVNTLIAGKEAVAEVQAPSGGMPVGTAQVPHSFGDNIEAAHRAAQEALRQIMAADAA